MYNTLMLVLTNFVQVLTALTNFVLVLTAHTYHSCDVLVPNSIKKYIYFPWQKSKSDGQFFPPSSMSLLTMY